MPRIIVTAESPDRGEQPTVLLTERVTARDFESQHFQHQLVERLGWAVEDAQLTEDRPGAGGAESREDRAPEPLVDAGRSQRDAASVLTTAS